MGGKSLFKTVSFFLPQKSPEIEVSERGKMFIFSVKFSFFYEIITLNNGFLEELFSRFLGKLCSTLSVLISPSFE